MIEVEIKARINDENKIKDRLNEIKARFLNSEKQIDKVFGHPMFLDSNKKIIEGGIVSRIRCTNNKNVLEFKEILRKGGGIEVKSELGNMNVGIELLKKMGFKESFTISKSRENYDYNGFVISVDKVDRLGNFIEIEKMITSPEEREKVRKECIDMINVISPNLVIEDKKYGDLMQDIVNKG
jgi:adenylate cyclase class 2